MCLCAGAIFYNGDGESLGWLDAARRRTREGRGNCYHRDVYQEDDGLVDYDNVDHDDEVVVVDHEFNSLDCVLQHLYHQTIFEDEAESKALQLQLFTADLS